MSLFSTLNTGVSGMTNSRTQLATTSHNISNVNSDYYTRQRVTSSAVYSKDGPINTGLGVRETNIVRLHDEFVYKRLKSSSGNLEYTSFSKRTLEEVGQYFPDLKKVGLKEDIAAYFNAWNNFASNTNEGAQKTNLVTTTQTLTADLQDTRSKVRVLQKSINDQMKISVDELNRLGKQIVNINQEITRIEAVEPTVANDLRDQRDKLELSMAKLINISVFKGNIQSDMSIDSQLTDQGRKYNINIAGASFVDGHTFNPIVIENKTNPASFYSVYLQRKDESKTDLTTLMTGGKIGAMLDLRGRNLDISAKNGYPTDGTLQGYIDDLDSLAKTLIVKTNNIYAQSSQDNMVSSTKELLKSNSALTSYDRTMKTGSFDVIVYDTKGNEVAIKTININSSTTMDDTTSGNSIVGDFNADTDDNDDNDITNDVNDYFRAAYKYDHKDRSGVLEFNSIENNGYTIAIKDHGTNFAGVIGMSRFFSGDNASNINVESALRDEPGKLHGYGAPLAGNNDMANNMIQIQYEKVEFRRNNQEVSHETIEGFYRFVTSTIASDAEQSRLNNDTNKAIFQTVNEEFQSVSGVSLDEELADLMKFQTAYSSNAKILTTIDKMLDTLLGIKQ